MFFIYLGNAFALSIYHYCQINLHTHALMHDILTDFSPLSIKMCSRGLCFRGMTISKEHFINISLFGLTN